MHTNTADQWLFSVLAPFHPLLPQYIGLSLLPPHLLEELLVEAISLEDDQFPRVVKWLGGPDDAHTRYFQVCFNQTVKL